MKIDLNLPAGIPQQRFLDYLNSQLRERMTQSFGSAQYGADGSFESSVIGPFLVDQDPISLNWVYRKSPDGTLLELEVMTTADTPSTNWQTAVHELVNSVYAAALAERRQLQFRRETFFYVGSVLDGEYWISGARFAPVWPEDDQPCLLNAERAVSIDQRISALDSLDAHSLRRESSARLAARLSLLLNVGLYRGKQELRWVIPLARDGVQLPASERVHLGFHGLGPQLVDMPQKGAVCPLGKYAGSLTSRFRTAGEPLSLPKEARRVLRAIDQAAPTISGAFDRGARLYQVAAVVGGQFPCVGLAYRVAAVEAISKADPACNGFSEFMRKYVRSIGNLDAILEFCYGTVRSGHFHSGEFPLGEFDREPKFGVMLDSEYVMMSNLTRVAHETTREAIVNWVIARLPSTDENDD